MIERGVITCIALSTIFCAWKLFIISVRIEYIEILLSKMITQNSKLIIQNKSNKKDSMGKKDT